MKKIRNTVLGLAVSFTVCQCGGGIGEKPTQASGTFSEVQAASVASSNASVSLGASDPFNAGQLNSVSQVSTVSTDRESPSCLSTSESADVDEDNIPANQTLTADCKDQTSGDTTFSASGTITVKDDDDSDATSGLFASANFALSIKSEATTVTVTLEGEIDSTKNTENYTVSSAFFVEAKTSASTISQTAKISYWMDSTVTPTDMQSPGTSGAVELNGALKSEAQGQNFTLLVTSEDLQYGSCSSARATTSLNWKSGRVVFTDGSNNKLTGTYSNCSLTWDFNGSSIS